MQPTISTVPLEIGVHEVELSLPVGFWHLLEDPFAMLPDAVVLWIHEEGFVGQFEILLQQRLLVLSRSAGRCDELGSRVLNEVRN